MTESLRFTWRLLVLASILILTGLLSLHAFRIPLSPDMFLATLITVTMITLISFVLMSAGIRKSGEGGVTLVLAGVGVKFLLYLVFILMVRLVVKNLTKPFILTFFALYLVFTFFLAIHLFKLLRNK